MDFYGLNPLAILGKYSPASAWIIHLSKISPIFPVEVISQNSDNVLNFNKSLIECDKHMAQKFTKGIINHY